jgi:uncharacterized protein (DUF4415 family)
MPGWSGGAQRRNTTGRDPMKDDRTRRIVDPRKTAEAAFKSATTKPVETPVAKPALPGVKELVSLRLDKDVLEHFQEGGSGWQDRINDVLRKVAGK